MEKQPFVVTYGALTAISDGEMTAVYNGESLAVSVLETASRITCDNDLRSALMALENGGTDRAAQCIKLPILTQTFAALLDQRVHTGLSRLTLNIANACNLWCSYCYADHGTYHAPASLMSPEHAVAAVARSLEFYSSIRSVQFFGGEPLLNPDAIDAVCCFLKRELGPRCPAFVATTNGTVLDEEVQSLLQTHNIGLTISLDGPATIHDRLRPARGGATSHQTIIQNLERLRSLDIDIELECTYTLAHHEARISVCDLLDYFWEELGASKPHIAWSYLPRPAAVSDRERKLAVFRTDTEAQARQHLPSELLCSLFREGARKSMENVASGKGASLTFVLGILDRLATRLPATGYCPAFTSQLSIATDGGVYPCFMFIGDPRMRMGDIFEPSFPGKDVADIWTKYQSAFSDSATGSTGWYSALVSGCVAGDYIATGSLGERLYEQVQEAMIEEVILGLAKRH